MTAAPAVPSTRGSWPPRWSRRRLLGSAAAAVGGWAMVRRASLAEEPLHIRLGWWAGAGIASGYAQGFELGVEEAGRLAELLGATLAVERADGALAEALPRLQAAGAAVAIAAAAPRELAAAATAQGRPAVLAIAPAEDDEPVAGVLRVGWPRSWRESAIAERTEAAAPGRVVVDWHPALERHGAAQLNDRFSRRFGAPMREEAWRAWIAVKAAVEGLVRAAAGGGSAAALLALVLDGHHGTPLRFSSSGLLLHPAYLAAAPAGGEVEATLSIPPHA